MPTRSQLAHTLVCSDTLACYVCCRHHCNISTGDDNVALHFNNTLIEKNFFGTGHGASIGSLGPGSAWLTNITVRDKFVPL